jgi:hypothetical protein
MPLWVAEVSADTARQAGVWLHPLGAVASDPTSTPLTSHRSPERARPRAQASQCCPTEPGTAVALSAI